MRNNGTASLALRDQQPQSAAVGSGRKPEIAGAARRGERAFDPTIWEYTLGRKVVDARAACLQELTHIPTGLGRLAYLAILQQRLLEDHQELFEEWFSCSLQQKYEWLYRLLTSASYGGTLPDEWLDPALYAGLIPRSAGEGARALYQTEIAAVLEILEKELAGAEFPKAKNLAGAAPIRTVAR
jgi:hypothetical protein